MKLSILPLPKLSFLTTSSPSSVERLRLLKSFTTVSTPFTLPFTLSLTFPFTFLGLKSSSLLESLPGLACSSSCRLRVPRLTLEPALAPPLSMCRNPERLRRRLWPWPGEHTLCVSR